ncbi:MAG: polyprenyl diphosphate synthase [Caldiserica bacterium]|nr:polyprenyl diphosphate synthase [Caldisericota bacterium]
MTTSSQLHVAIVMDGNGRWAIDRGLPRVAGHRQGAQVVHDIVAAAPGLGVTALTIFAFSTENWKRPPDEVSYILHLFVTMVKKWLPELISQHVRVRIIGDRAALPGDVGASVETIEERTASCDGLHLNVALNYGGRAEILHATRTFAAECAAGTAAPEDLTEDRFSSYLWLAGEASPDIVVRTGAESRVSNFLLWEMAYAELFFLDVLWPDFTPATLDMIVQKFNSRNRRFGGS